MSLSVLLVFLVCSGTVSPRGRWSVVASPVIIESKTVDIGVKVENIKVEYCGPPDPTFLLVVKETGANPPRFSGHVQMTPKVDVFQVDHTTSFYLNGILIMQGPNHVPRHPPGFYVKHSYFPIFANEKFTAEKHNVVSHRFVLPKGHYMVHYIVTNQDGVEIMCLRGSGDILS